MRRTAGKRTSKKPADEAKIKLNDGYVLSRGLIDAILRLSPSGIAIIGSDFIIEYISDRGCNIFGATREELVGHDFRDFLQKDSLRMVAERYQLRREGKDVPSVYPFHLIRSDGEELTVEGRADIVIDPDGVQRTIAHFLDITQIERGQELLEESETRYQFLIETMNDGLVIDDGNGVLTYANDAFCRMINNSQENIIGKPWVSLVKDLSTDSIMEKIADRKKGISERYELTWRSSTGDLVPTIVSATPLFDRFDNFIGTFAIVTEIKAQKDAEETIQFYLDLLSHDVANQLQVIMTSTGLLDEEVPQSYVTDARRDILDAVERCNRLITKVKRAAQIREVPLSSIDLKQVLSEKIKVLEKVYGAEVHLEGVKKTIMVEADILLGEFLWNLLENAARHNPTDHKEVWIAVKSKGNFIELTISDNGPGLSDARKPVLFTERKYGGGVGLRLIRQMIRKYGGSIEVKDRVDGTPSEGSKFIVTLRKSKK
ncbi:MAG: PAS domain S-box protein [Candidatus Odinarchaeota archaeon]